MYRGEEEAVNSMPDLHVAVIYDSRYGTTAKVAEALVRGLGKVPGLSAELDFAPNVHAEVLDRSELIIIGGPTEYLSASRHLRELFGLIGAYDLKDKFGFAFDTHARRPFSGSAARFIERKMRALRLHLLEPTSSALVEDGADSSGKGSIHLAEGTEAHFEQIGEQLGRDLLAAAQKRRESLRFEIEEPGWAD